MQRIGEALQRRQRPGGKVSNYKTTSRWLYIRFYEKNRFLIRFGSAGRGLFAQTGCYNPGSNHTGAGTCNAAAVGSGTPNVG